jgi:hypothetical protein
MPDWEPARDELLKLGRPPRVPASPFRYSKRFSKDIASLKSTWGIFYYNCWNENFYRFEQVQYLRTVPPYLSLWWEYKPTPTWSLHVELDNVGRFGYEDKFYNYAGPRNSSPLQSIDDLYIHSQPRLYVQVRKTFD